MLGKQLRLTETAKAKFD